MPWMTSNGHEYNPNRIKEKNRLFLSRAKRLMDDDTYERFYILLNECTNKELDRDIEFRIMLDVLELLSIGVEEELVAKIANQDIMLEVDLERISPVQACVARDCIETFAPDTFDFNSLLPESSFLKKRTGAVLAKMNNSQIEINN